MAVRRRFEEKPGRACCPAHCEDSGRRHVKPSEVVSRGIALGYEVGLSEDQPGIVSYAFRLKTGPRYPRNITICKTTKDALDFLEK